MTPEGVVKKRIRTVLDRYKGLYAYMPVPSGYGGTSVDFICCYRGRFFMIEAKAKGRKPTAKQDAVMELVRAAGGKTFIINNDLNTIIALVSWLNSVPEMEPSNDPDIKAD